MIVVHLPRYLEKGGQAQSVAMTSKAMSTKQKGLTGSTPEVHQERNQRRNKRVSRVVKTLLGSLQFSGRKVGDVKSFVVQDVPLASQIRPLV